jgi:hypothetical protein
MLTLLYCDYERGVDARVQAPHPEVSDVRVGGGGQHDAGGDFEGD